MSTRTRAPTVRDDPPQKTKLIGVLFALGGGAFVLSGLFVLVASSALADSGMGGLAGLGAILGVVVLAVAGLSITISYGLWTVKQWGWYGAVVLLGLGVASGAWSLVSGAGISVVSLLIGTGSLWALWDEQAAFGLDHELPV